jgi:copper(I)-binding protein
MIKNTLFAAICAAVLVSHAAAAQSSPPSPADIMVDDAWARATSPSQKVGGIFVSIMEMGAPDKLVSVSSPIADSLELHETINDNGIMKMRPVAALPLASGETVELKPGGYHIMAMGLKQQLVPGASFPVTLHFEKAGDVTVTATVKAAGASSSGMQMDHSAMPGMTKP